MECFKQASPEETGERHPETINANAPDWVQDLESKLYHKHVWASPRRETKCPGCGEPIFTAPDFRSMRLSVCSARCYQRVYRKRRRDHGSTIDWKGDDRRIICEACKRPLPEGQRRDPRFCSNRCRQWTYRRRHQPAAP
jgi:hypothetical protein